MSANSIISYKLWEQDSNPHIYSIADFIKNVFLYAPHFTGGEEEIRTLVSIGYPQTRFRGMLLMTTRTLLHFQYVIMLTLLVSIEGFEPSRFPARF